MSFIMGDKITVPLGGMILLCNLILEYNYR